MEQEAGDAHRCLQPNGGTPEQRAVAELALGELLRPRLPD